MAIPVPDCGPLLIEAMVNNRDVGFVHAGQSVAVKIETFQFTRNGLLHGHVVDISQDATTESQSKLQHGGENGEQVRDGDAPENEPSHYVAHIALDLSAMTIDGHQQYLQPGMSTTAEIKTGSRSVIDYLILPLAQVVHNSIRER